MAENRLPAAVTDILETPLGEDVTVPTVEPVRVNTRDEVSDVADALNTVQDSALDLAVEQAVLRRNIADSFVNLGRRNQNLLGRQLDFITELETNETDADTLSNLFRLDHLATRMRRNAESLLVLAGIEPPRQWAAPVRLTDVIRAALGEVEDYQRVTVRGVEPATIIGSAAADLAHLLAELIENALVFSPPDQTVDIRGRNRPGQGGDGIATATRSPSSTRASACRPGTSRPPTGASPGPRASRSRRRSTWATTWPATSPPATTSGSPRQLPGQRHHRHPRPPAGPAHERQRAGRRAGPAGARVGGRRRVRGARAAARCAACGRRRRPRPCSTPRSSTGSPRSVRPPRCPRPRPPSRRRRRPAPPAAWSSGRGAGPRPHRPRPCPTASCWPACRASPATCRGRLRSIPPAPAAREATRPATRGRLPRTTTARSRTARGRPRPTSGGPRRRPTTSAARPCRARGGNGAPDLPGPAGPPPADAAGEATASGLARRVRGAQLPATQPLNLRRRQDHPSGPPAGYRLDDHDDATGHTLGNGNTNGHTNGLANGHDHGRAAAGTTGNGDHDNSAATSVYGFLTSFTQGVQRGLEEARRDPNTPKENP